VSLLDKRRLDAGKDIGTPAARCEVTRAFVEEMKELVIRRREERARRRDEWRERDAARQAGLYWARRRNGEWGIAEWSEGDWLFTGDEIPYQSVDLIDVDERPIVRQEP
jgi:hypothetical protein